MSDSPNQNILSLSLPTDLLTGAGGGSGLSLNYNFGPNVDTLAQNAYGFLNTQFAGAQTFQAASQTSAQNFLSAETQPIVNAVAGESDSYYSQILGAFTGTLNAQQSLGSQGIATQGQVANASISASKKASGGGSLFSSIFGGCFITTAVCKYSGLPDDCYTLQTMRAWRDGWMQETEQRRNMVERYYLCAPDYVEKISALPEKDQPAIWHELARLIATACHHIRVRDNARALAYYLAAVEFARVCAGES